MKKLITILLLAFCIPLLSQNQDFGKLDFSMAIGVQSSFNSLNLQEYQAKYPESEILNRDYSNFSRQNYGYNGDITSLQFLFGYQLKSNDRIENRLRMGISYGGFSIGTSSYFNTTSHAYDTLTSSRTNEEFYVDSVYSENLDFRSNAQQVGLDLSYIFRANPYGRWSFYTGIGLELGVNFNTKFEANYYGGSYYQSEGTYSYYNFEETQNSSVFEQEIYDIDDSFYTKLYVPIGINFRIAKNNNFWKHVLIYSEFRPAIQFSNIENNSQIDPILGFAILGLRYQF
jgi:hypothetical protein